MDFDKATRTRETCFVIPTPVVILILLNLIMYKLQIVRARFQNFVCLDFLRYFSICITNFIKTTNYTRPTGACNFVIFENLLVLIYSKLHLKSCFIASHCLALHLVVLICMISFLFFFSLIESILISTKLPKVLNIAKKKYNTFEQNGKTVS